MKSKIYLSLIAMIISAVGCHKEENNISQATSSGFPDTVVQKGSDEDTTYFSIRTSHQLNGTLNIDVSGWESRKQVCTLMRARAIVFSPCA